MTMPDEPAAEGSGLFSKKIMGIPVVVVLAGIAILAYWYLSKHSSSAAGSSSGGGGTSTTGNTNIRKGAITVNVTQGGKKNPQPRVSVPPRKKTMHKHPVHEPTPPRRKRKGKLPGGKEPAKKGAPAKVTHHKAPKTPNTAMKPGG